MQRVRTVWFYSTQGRHRQFLNLFLVRYVSLEFSSRKGRFFPQKSSCKNYPTFRLDTLPNPDSTVFADLTKECRSVILAGGTMKPYETLKQQLLSSLKSEINWFSCMHVIAKHQMQAFIIQKVNFHSKADFYPVLGNRRRAL